MEELVEEIYGKFIADSAKTEVCLDSQCRLNLEKNLQNATRTSFDEAQMQVYKGMERDSYPRFIRSRTYIDFLMTQISAQTKRVWATDFDQLMEHDEGRTLFRDFLILEKADENIKFWDATQDYKKISNCRHRKTRAREIYQQFVSTDSRTEISIDGPTREYIKLNYDKGELKLFEGAEKHIYLLMKRDCYPRFVKSTFFLQFFNANNNENNANGEENQIRKETD